MGLVRTLGLEYPETAPVLIDFGAEDATAKGALAEAEAMLTDEIDNGKQPLVAFRRGNRYVARLVHQSSTEEDAPRKLVLNKSGRLEDLQIAPIARQSPKANQVEIRVRTAGLNFRDVLTALGMLPPRASIPGAECAGTIVRVGSEVWGFTVGDAVMAFAPSSLQTFVNVPADFIAAKPAAMSFVEAAGIPVAFLTARYGLTHLANLSAGQTILIHAAAGGLGLAAVQLAMRAGAKIFATAGSPEKREFLKQLGVEHVFDSRLLTFRSQVLDATGGRGVDVVLNSLAGDFIRASFDAVAQNGCFLEVGKRGIWSVEEVAALDKNIRYFPYDLGDVAME
ncbi:MAG TPA: zinc-binding dehydrogenase, partial [Acidobacteriaceae bacterium]|nr:zinc-binding dehydrogenase [Acidobacteriaceae bacterium]